MPLLNHPSLEELLDEAVRLDGRPIPGLRLTAEEYDAWLPDGIRAEWVDGEVLVMAPASFEHEDLIIWLGAVLRAYVEQHNLGRIIGSQFTLRLPGRRRMPDLMFFAEEKRDRVNPTFFAGAPDLIIEVVSTDSRNRDRRDKFLDYQTARVREYWIIDPTLKVVDLYVLNDSGVYEERLPSDNKLSSSVLPGFFLCPDWFAHPELPRIAHALRQLGVSQ